MRGMEIWILSVIAGRYTRVRFPAEIAVTTIPGPIIGPLYGSLQHRQKHSTRPPK